MSKKEIEIYFRKSVNAVRYYYDLKFLRSF